MSRLAILCPGQGAQHPHMFDFAHVVLSADVVPDHWALEQALGMPLDAALNDKAMLFSNRIAQPLIVAATMSTWAAIRNLLPQPALVVGYSIGEVSAYAITNGLQPEEAIRLAARRAQLMDACLDPDAPQALVAVSGLTRQALAGLLDQYGFAIAIETGEDSIIAGGLAASLPALQQKIIDLGGHPTVLPVEIASHTPLMHAAVEPFRQALHQSGLADPEVPVLAGVLGEAVSRKEQAIATLARQLEETIRWKDCMDACAEAGITVALELGPGSALSRMLQARHPDIACRSIADFRSAAGVGAWVGRQLD
ncbi:ACP S-malonyltransferase [Noviherbaspirillum massiliense]|uniref:ACP S-malonyltransferase n=1 Tax=Noviherbaspirillum massiliense TaxID=1465823 RepID=UPI0002D5B6FD|nr:acyltransferase domain-containing protein [Noviherbaspirillum massiliense]